MRLLGTPRNAISYLVVLLALVAFVFATRFSPELKRVPLEVSVPSTTQLDSQALFSAAEKAVFAAVEPCDMPFQWQIELVFEPSGLTGASYIGTRIPDVDCLATRLGESPWPTTTHPGETVVISQR